MGDKRAYIIASAVFLILLIFPLAVGSFFYSNVSTLNQGAIISRRTTASLTADAVQAKVSHLVDIASSMASDKNIVADVANGKWEDAANVTRDLQNNIDYYDTYVDRIVLFDTKGIERSAYPQLVGGIGADISNSSYFQQVLGGAPYVVSNVVRRASQPQINVVEVLVPVNMQGTFEGVIEFQIPTISFLEFDSDVSLGTYGFAYIIDGVGNIVAHPKFASEQGNIVNVSSTPIAQKVLSGSTGYDESYSEIDNEKSFTTYAPIPVYKWGVIFQEPYNEVFGSSESILRAIGIDSFVFVIFDCAMACLTFWLFKKKNKKNG